MFAKGKEQSLKQKAFEPYNEIFVISLFFYFYFLFFFLLLAVAQGAEDAALCNLGVSSLCRSFECAGTLPELKLMTLDATISLDDGALQYEGIGIHRVHSKRWIINAWLQVNFPPRRGGEGGCGLNSRKGREYQMRSVIVTWRSAVQTTPSTAVASFQSNWWVCGNLKKQRGFLLYSSVYF